MIQTSQFCSALYKKEAESLLIYLFLLLSSGKLQLPRFQQHNSKMYHCQLCSSVNPEGKDAVVWHVKFHFTGRTAYLVVTCVWRYIWEVSMCLSVLLYLVCDALSMFFLLGKMMHCQSTFFFSLERRCIVKTERIVDQAWSLRIRKENKLVSLPVKMKVWWGDYRTYKSRR